MSIQDIEELAELAKAPYAPTAKSQIKATPASLSHAQATPAQTSTVRLISVRNIRHVNALGEGPVPFGGKDLVIIYGGNASGKSGIARILKKSCRARDPGGEVLSNVFEPPTTELAAATIDFQVEGKDSTYEWTLGGPVCPDLLSVNTFDSRCASVQVEKSNLVLYTPEILKAFRSLATVVDEVARKLRDERTLLGTRPLFLDELRLSPGTPTNQFISSLNADSDLNRLSATHTPTSKTLERLAELDRALANDPLQRAQSEQAREARLVELTLLAADTERLLTDEACDQFEALLAKRKEVHQALDVSRNALSRISFLDGLGTATWRALWEAARRYSETHVYKGERFPVVREGAVCVLCQRPLDKTATDRIHTFEEFVQADIQKQADKIDDDFETALARIKSISLPEASRIAIRDAQLIGSPFEDSIKRFLVCSKLRRRYLLRLAIGRSKSTRPPFKKLPDITSLVESVRAEIANLKQAMQAESRVRLEKERLELRDQKSIRQHISSIRNEIGRLGRIKVLDSALNDCRTQAITLEARQAETLILTHSLRANFTSYLSDMGFAGMPVEINIGAGDHGQHPYDMTLIPRPGVRPVEVLSEGERTCVALAGFLGELRTTGNSSAIVLDDPVSSLDHNYRKRVAEVLVREAKKRQVIVLTHDIVFFFLARKYASELGVNISEISLQKGHRKDFGRTIEGPPWVAMSLKQRLTELRNELVEARKLLKNGDRPGYERSAVMIYGKLRQSWERAVEEVLLNQTVLRFGESVQTQRLAKLTDISDSDIELVTKEMSRCSDFVHDEAGVVHSDVPEPDIVENDIAKLDSWVKELRRHRGRG
ncbi:MAG: AAA family ATPase [Pyrinomonadaceae bacterium]